MTEIHTYRIALAIADHLADPNTTPELPTAQNRWRQSLAHGVPGIALLHIELAARGDRPWQRAHEWLSRATDGPITSGADSFLFHGAPAVAHALSSAAAVRPKTYARALGTMDAAITADVHRRVDAAHRRIDAGRLPALSEFDLIRGLTGMGAYLLRRDPSGTALRAVLEYLVRLVEPVQADGDVLPGWWTTSDPAGRSNERFPGGHANSGVAHGVAGPLSLLALAMQRGTTVTGQAEAIRAICGWLDRWRTDTERGPVWPYWVTLAQVRAGCAASPSVARPSWCYGTAGLARAQQVAALATGDLDRRTHAESALVQALADPVQLAATYDTTLCHGFAGLAHLAVRTAADAQPNTAARLRELIPRLLGAIEPATDDGVAGVASRSGPGLLEGAAGIALGVLAPSTSTLPQSGWDTSLLIA